MANYYTHFSVMLPLGSPERIGPALAIYRKLAEDLDREDGAGIGFTATAAPEVDPAALWLSTEEDGNPEHVIAFAQLCGATFRLTGRWGFRWALTCSRMRLDGWGGGAHVLDLATGETVEWLDCEHWLAERLAKAVLPATELTTTPLTVSASAAVTAECLLREAAEKHRSLMAIEPSLACEINADAAELLEVGRRARRTAAARGRHHAAGLSHVALPVLRPGAGVRPARGVEQPRVHGLDVL